MRRITSLFTFFYLLSTSFSAYGQQDSISDWHEQVLSQIDADNFSEASYARLIEMLSDLELRRHDTLSHVSVRQNVILSSNACLNIREGYHHVTDDKILSNKAYRGDMWSHTLRYKLQYGRDWSAGIVLDKDAGEPFRRVFPLSDSYSGFVAYSPAAMSPDRVVRLAKAIVGHYRLRLGSGLILNQSFSLGKGVMTDAFMTSGTAISPHSSADEYNRMQGVVADVRIGSFRAVPFVSFKQLDAVVRDDTITSIPTDGFHRTYGEEQKHHAATVLNSGLHLAYAGNWYNIGANMLYTRFSHPFYRPLRAYNHYYFRGQQLLQGSIDYHARRLGFELRGETAIDHALNLASVGQIAHSVGEDWQAALSYRYYGNRYQQLYASSISEGSGLQGEQGATLAFSGAPLPYWQFAFSFDYFRFSNVQYGYDAPFRGVESRLSAQYARRKCDISLSYRLKSKRSLRHHSLDALFSYTIVDGLRLRTQVRCKYRSSLGYAIAQAIGWKKDGALLSADFQCAWFDAPDYDSRLYLSEKNVLYGFGLPMLYGRGVRLASTASCRICSFLTLELKYSLFHYLDRNHISSGLQQIWGANQSNLWLQLRAKL